MRGKFALASAQIHQLGRVKCLSIKSPEMLSRVNAIATDSINKFIMVDPLASIRDSCSSHRRTRRRPHAYDDSCHMPRE